MPPNIDNFNDIDMEISATELSLKTIHGQKLNFKFGSTVDNHNPVAKWDKKKKILKLVLTIK